jgi:hypothetical protein
MVMSQKTQFDSDRCRPTAEPVLPWAMIQVAEPELAKGDTLGEEIDGISNMHRTRRFRGFLHRLPKQEVSHSTTVKFRLSRHMKQKQSFKVPSRTGSLHSSATTVERVPRRRLWPWRRRGMCALCPPFWRVPSRTQKSRRRSLNNFSVVCSRADRITKPASIRKSQIGDIKRGKIIQRRRASQSSTPEHVGGSCVSLERGEKCSSASGETAQSQPPFLGRSVLKMPKRNVAQAIASPPPTSRKWVDETRFGARKGTPLSGRCVL